MTSIRPFHTLKSGLQWRSGGSGGYGAPSRNRSLSVICVLGRWLWIIDAVSRARDIVEWITVTYGNSSSASLWPVRSACWIPGHIMTILSPKVHLVTDTKKPDDLPLAFSAFTLLAGWRDMHLTIKTFASKLPWIFLWPLKYSVDKNSFSLSHEYALNKDDFFFFFRGKLLSAALPYWRLDAKRSYLLPSSKPYGPSYDWMTGEWRLKIKGTTSWPGFTWKMAITWCVHM